MPHANPSHVLNRLPCHLARLFPPSLPFSRDSPLSSKCIPPLFHNFPCRDGTIRLFPPPRLRGTAVALPPRRRNRDEAQREYAERFETLAAWRRWSLPHNSHGFPPLGPRIFRSFAPPRPSTNYRRNNFPRRFAGATVLVGMPRLPNGEPNPAAWSAPGPRAGPLVVDVILQGHAERRKGPESDSHQARIRVRSRCAAGRRAAA